MHGSSKYRRQFEYGIYNIIIPINNLGVKYGQGSWMTPKSSGEILGHNGVYCENQEHTVGSGENSTSAVLIVLLGLEILCNLYKILYLNDCVFCRNCMSSHSRG